MGRSVIGWLFYRISFIFQATPVGERARIGEWGRSETLRGKAARLPVRWSSSIYDGETASGVPPTG